MSDSYTPPIKINRINRNFGIKVHLYYNKDSHNRDSDSTPRFYLKAVSLLTVEGVAFTSKSVENYSAYGNRFWRYKSDESLTNERAEAIFSDIQQSYPYGYKEGDTASYNKYILDVKQSDTFQSFYKKYWEDNENKIINPKTKIDGTLEYPHPYIEILRDEIVVNKYNVGTVPTLEDSNLLAAEYTGNLNLYYDEPESWACMSDSIQVGTSGDKFITEGFPIYSLKLQASGRHRIDLTANVDNKYFWPTGAGSTFSGYRWRLSTGVEGTHNGYTEYSDGVSYIKTPEYGYFDTKVIAKTSYLGGSDDTHPYYYSGSSSGFALSGSGSGTTATGINVSGYGHDEGPLLTLQRDSTYEFRQYDSSNAGHKMYISTNPSGQNSFIYSSGVTYAGTAGGDGILKFDVPVDAPDTLYYACENHAYMGGIINLVDPPAAPLTGSVPGESIVINSTGTGDMLLYYYSPDLSGMGGYAFMKKDCDSNTIFGT